MEWVDFKFFESDIFRVKILNALGDAKRDGHVVLPDRSKILRALELTPPDEVKVVILGQDPYPTEGHANGLSFSVNPEVTPLPKSLINIFRELKDDLGIEKENGDLTSWALQGVLLLNTVLTVYKGQPASHTGMGWEVLSTDIIKWLSEHKEHIVFILWGKNAQKKGMYINESKHLIINSPHPSPLSAHRGFFGSKPFSRTNKYLTENEIIPIKW